MDSMIKNFSCLLFLLPFILHTTQPLHAAETLSLVSQNMNRFFDDKDDGQNEKIVKRETYQKRVKQLTEKIITSFALPDILALQEVENLDILQDVVKRLQKKGLDYEAVLMEGHDVSGIDVGFLVKKHYRVTQQSQLFRQLHLADSDNYLFSRPPLLIKVCKNDCTTIVNLHLRSMRGLRDKKDRYRVAIKRKLQAETLAQWVNQFQNSHPQQRLILVGDFNALPLSDRYVDVIGTIRGQPDQTRPKWKSNDLVEKDLKDLTLSVPAMNRFSFLYKRHKQQLDYLLISDSKNYRLKSLKFEHLDYKFSDHAALVAELELLH